ncbi:hypothetical protein HGA34_02815 [Candidatus Falkowbacteria bacterium]|nr:hypothetical protein [Candidatus Falkowbacteria bacterium]
MLNHEQAKAVLTLKHLKAHSLSDLGPLHQQTYHSFISYIQNRHCNNPLALVSVPFRDDLAARFGVDGLVVLLTERSWSNLLYMDRAIFKSSPAVHVVNSMIRDSFNISQCSISCIKFC